MPRFILINETTKHTCFVSRDEIVRLIRGPGGYSDVERCISMIEDGMETKQGKQYMPFPLNGPAIAGIPTKLTIHVEGRMDYQRRDYRNPCLQCGMKNGPCLHRQELIWVEPNHRCEPRCLTQPLVQVSQSLFGYR